jgi:uncharacterized membrane protein
MVYITNKIKGGNNMILDQTRGPIEVHKGDHGGNAMMILAVMVILVIFIFVVFAIFAFRDERKKHDGGDNKIAESAMLAMAVAQANKSHYPMPEYGYGGKQDILLHDINRDTLKGFGEVEKEIAVAKADTDAKIAQYFFQTQEKINQSAHDTYKAIRDSEDRRRADELAKERDNSLFNRIIGYHAHTRPPAFGMSNFYASNEQAVGGYA